MEDNINTKKKLPKKKFNRNNTVYLKRVRKIIRRNVNI